VPLVLTPPLGRNRSIKPKNVIKWHHFW
jgi:hypothetical protein